MPLYQVFELDLFVYKVQQIAFFVGALALLGLLWSRELSQPKLILLLAIVGFNPAFWNLKDVLWADIPFLFVVLLATLVIEKLDWTMDTRKDRWRAVAIGVALYLCYAMKFHGLIMLPAFVAYDVVRRRKIDWRPFAVCGVWLVPAVLWSLSTHMEQSMFVAAAVDKPNVLRNASWYALKLSIGIWFTKEWSSIFAGVLITVLALCGFVTHLRRKLSMRDWMILVFVGSCPVTWTHVRYVLQTLAMMPAYALYFIESIQNSKLQKVLLVAFVVAIAASYIDVYRNLNFGNITTGIGTPESQEFFEYAKRNIPPDQVVVFFEPRVLTLWTGLKTTSIAPIRNDDAAQFAELKKVNAKYFILGPSQIVFGPEGDREQREFVRRNAECFKQIWSNKDFQVFEITQLK
jgi:hypothetical protein